MSRVRSAARNPGTDSPCVKLAVSPDGLAVFIWYLPTVAIADRQPGVRLGRLYPLLLNSICSLFGPAQSPVPRPVPAIHHGGGLTDGSRAKPDPRAARPLRASMGRISGEAVPLMRLTGRRHACGRLRANSLCSPDFRRLDLSTDRGRQLPARIYRYFSIGFRGVAMPYRFLALGGGDALQRGVAMPVDNRGFPTPFLWIVPGRLIDWRGEESTWNRRPTCNAVSLMPA